MHFKTLSNVVPTYPNIVFKFYMACLVYFSTPPGTNYPVFGSSPIWPDKYIILWNIFAVEYGPIAFGPLVVLKVLISYGPVIDLSSIVY